MSTPTPQLATALVRSFIGLSIRYDRMRTALAAHLLVNPTDLRAMALLSESPLTPTELARCLDITAGSVTPLVDRLAGKGLVARRAHPVDRRSLQLVLTAAGDHALGQAAALMEKAVHRAAGTRTDAEMVLIMGFLADAGRAFDRLADGLVGAPARSLQQGRTG